MILGIENQSHVHYAMPVRNMLYDAMEYVNQVKRIAGRYRKEKKASKLNSGEFLTGFSKNDELIPVITLVLYLGTDPWDGPRSLYEMFGDENEKILPFVPNYKINLIEPQRMSDEEINRFHTDLREVLLYIKYSREKEKLMELLENDTGFQNLKTETAIMLNKLTNSRFCQSKQSRYC